MAEHSAPLRGTAGTETIDPRYRGLDAWDDPAILQAFAEGQARAISAVADALPAIAAAAAGIVARIGAEGRLVYVGAGSSGRLAALDGMELGATFGWPSARIALALAEGAALDPGMPNAGEDDAAAGEDAMRRLTLRPADCVIAVAASGRTPFTLAAARLAGSEGALVVTIANNPEAPLLAAVDHPILLATGAEAISGSTRMNAGTAQKAALGLLSSLVMTRLGHVHDGLMVSMRADCAKLERRAAEIVAAVAGCPIGEARAALQRSGGHIKAAVLLARGVQAGHAAVLLAEAGGNLRVALGRLSCSE